MCNVNPQTDNFIYALVASNCCMCGKGLKDSESKALGMGPDCSGKHYSPSHVPSELDIMNAMGLVHKGSVEGHFSQDVVNELRSLKGNARKFSNRLVLHTALHYENRETVFACAGVIRALGYNSMADQLEVNRVRARITEDGDVLKVHMNRNQDIDRDMKKIPGAQNNLPKEGHKVGWTIPKEQKDHFLCLLGVHQHGHFLMEGKTISLIKRRSKYELYRFQRPARPASPRPTAPSQSNTLSGVGPDGLVEVLVGAQEVQIRTPYKEAFKDALKANIPYRDRSWRGFWAVRATHLDQVKGLIQTHFGVAL